MIELFTVRRNTCSNLYVVYLVFMVRLKLITQSMISKSKSVVIAWKI